MMKLSFFKVLFILIALASTLSIQAQCSECGNCVSQVNCLLKARGYNTMPGGLFTYANYVSNLTPTTSSPAVNYVGFCRAYNTKTKKWNHATLGHVFIINSVNSDGTLNISEGNINSECRTSTITPSSRTGLQYWKPSKK